ncbi:unnamed protein product [Linum trigynum]|uniref:Uncharacterized protein n=1 Tax=Linum trigynum TaxID=586398 RepID=A0AAV2G9X5_9ROSI
MAGRAIGSCMSTSPYDVNTSCCVTEDPPVYFVCQFPKIGLRITFPDSLCSYAPKPDCPLIKVYVRKIAVQAPFASMTKMIQTTTVDGSLPIPQ